jgi:hypothetical protein
MRRARGLSGRKLHTSRSRQACRFRMRQIAISRRVPFELHRASTLISLFRRQMSAICTLGTTSGPSADGLRTATDNHFSTMSVRPTPTLERRGNRTDRFGVASGESCLPGVNCLRNDGPTQSSPIAIAAPGRQTYRLCPMPSFTSARGLREVIG